MTDFKAKMHLIRFRPGSAQTPLGELTMLPDPLSGFGAASRQGRGWAGKRRQREGE